MNKKVSVVFMLMAVLFIVCLIASNLFATKVFALGSVTLPGAVIIFPISYILNDCFAEVCGYRKARLVIWTAFAMNFFVAIMDKSSLGSLQHHSGTGENISTMFSAWLRA